MRVWKRSILSVFLVVIIFSSIQVVSADPTVLPTGGDGFDTAVTIEPGSYETDHEIGWRDADIEYFKITELNAGQTLKVIITTDWVTDETAEASICSSSREELYKEGDSGKTVIASWATSSTDTFYIKIGGWVSDLQAGASIDISVENHYDANSGTDAGDTFDTAQTVTAGDYEGYLAGGKHGDEPGDDDKDYYIISLESGQLLDVTVTPPTDASFGLKICDQNRVEKASVYSASAGAITSTSWTAPSDQDVYVAITNFGGLSANGGTYSLSLSFEAAPGKATLTVQTTPVNGGVYVDGTLWGTAPQTRSVDPDTYTVSFEYVFGYTTPSSQLVTLVAGDSETVTGTYTEIDTDGNGGTGGGSPGFETLAVIAAIGVALIILRRRK